MQRSLIFTGAFLITAKIFSHAYAAETDIWEGVFNQEQVDRGRDLYGTHCASCHGQELVSDEPDYPPLTQPAFRWSWQGRTLEERHQRISSTMPPAKAGELSEQEYVDILAYILEFNGYPTGQEHLTYDKTLFESVEITATP